jgi:hypothetical protein
MPTTFSTGRLANAKKSGGGRQRKTLRDDMAVKRPGRGQRTSRGLKKVRQPSRRFGRAQVNVLLSDDLKDRLLHNAVKGGRTLSAEVTSVLEAAVALNRVFAANISGLHTTPEALAAQLLENEMRLFGYVPQRDLQDNVKWLPPNHPENPGRSAAMAPGEAKALLEQSDELWEARIEASVSKGEAEYRRRGGPPGMIGRGGFVAAEPGEWDAHAAAMTASEADIERRNAEAIKRANVGVAFDADASLKRAAEIDKMAKAPAVPSADVPPNFDAYDQLDQEKDDAA